MINKTKKNFLISFFLLSCCLTGSILHARDFTTYSVGDREIKAVRGELLVSFRSGLPRERIKEALRAHGGKKEEVLKHSGIVKLSLPSENMERVMREYNRDPAVEFAEPNLIYSTHERRDILRRLNLERKENYPDRISEDKKNIHERDHVSYKETSLQNLPPAYDTEEELEENQWGLEKIDAPEAWEVETGSSSVVIAVIDTGTDLKHPDLADNIWQNPKEEEDGQDNSGSGYVDDIHGWDFVDGNNDPNPADLEMETHGTHVAGIAAASGQREVVGVSQKSSIMALRVLGVMGFGTLEDISEAIFYAADNEAHIINMSLGGPSSYLMEKAVDYAFDKGTFVIAAAGNSSSTYISYPASYEKVFAVGASDSEDEKADFSDYGEGLEVVAPGVDILSAVPGEEYDEYSGTSMSAPLVSGLASLAISYCKRNGKTWSNTWIKDVLRRYSDGLNGKGYPQWDEETGYGRINCNSVMTFLMSGSTEPYLSLSEDSFDFSYAEGKELTGKSFYVSNSGGMDSSMSWTAEEDAAWLSVSPDSGSLSGGERQKVEVSVDIDELEEGTHTGEITVSCSDSENSPQKISAGLRIYPEGTHKLNVNQPETFWGNDTFNWTDPFNTYFDGSRTQTVYLAEELKEAGVKAGTIKVLRFKCFQEPGRPSLKNFSIRMKHSSKETSTEFEHVGWTEVFGPEDVEPVQGEWHSFELDNPFVWDGQSNLMIDIRRDDEDYEAGGGMYVRADLKERTFSGLKGSFFGETFNHVPSLIIEYEPPKPDEAIMALSEHSFSFSAIVDETLGRRESIKISNTGGKDSAFEWTAVSNKDWLSLSPGSGSISKNEDEETYLNVDSSVLDIGNYEAEIRVEGVDALNGLQKLPLTLQVTSERLDAVASASYQRSDIDYGSDVMVDEEGDIIVLGASFFEPGFILLKYDSDLNLLDYKNYYAEGFSNPPALTADSEENIIITVGSDGEAHTVKYDADMNKINSAVYEEDVSRGVTTDSDNNIIIAGGSGSDSFIKRYNSDLEEPETKVTGIGGYYISDVAADSENNIIITGDVDGEIHTIKYSSDLEEKVSVVYDENEDCFAEAMEMDSKGNIFIAGATVDEEGDFRFLTIKYSPDLTLIKSVVSETSESGVALGITLDGNDDVIISGGVGQIIPNMHIYKYDNDLNELASAVYASDGYDVSYNVAVDIKNNIIAVGESSEDIFVKKYLPFPGYEPSLEPYAVNPREIVFEAAWEGEVPPREVFLIRNNSSFVLEWEADASQEDKWIVLSSTFGKINPMGSERVEVSAEMDFLNHEENRGVVLLSSREDEKVIEEINVSLNKLSPESGRVIIRGGEKGYINPSRGEKADIVFNASRQGEVDFKIFDRRGRMVWEYSAKTSGGEDSVEWKGENRRGNSVSSGIYVLRIEGPGIRETQRIPVVR